MYIYVCVYMYTCVYIYFLIHSSGDGHLGSLHNLAIGFFFSVCLFLRERARQNVSGGGADREGDTESEAGSRF